MRQFGKLFEIVGQPGVAELGEELAQSLEVLDRASALSDSGDLCGWCRRRGWGGNTLRRFLESQCEGQGGWCTGKSGYQ